MKTRILIILLLMAIVSMSQTTITHREIVNDVTPAENIEMFYSNTGFAINAFNVSDKYTLLFSKYIQTFFLLDNNTHIILDQLQLKNIPGLKHNNAGLPSGIKMKQIKNKYKRYLTPNTMFSGQYLKDQINDTLYTAGTVSQSHTKHFMFHIGWTNKGKLFYRTIPLPQKSQFKKPLTPLKLKFNRYYKYQLVSFHPAQPNRLFLNRGIHYKIEHNKAIAKPSSPIIYSLNKNGIYDIEYTFENQNFPTSIIYKDVLFVTNQFNATQTYQISESTIDTIAQPGINYFNYYTIDLTTDKLYMISTILRYKPTGKNKFDENYMRKSTNKNEKNYELDIYEYDTLRQEFNPKYYLCIKGDLAQKMHAILPLSECIQHRIHDQILYFNLPDFSNNIIGGIYKIELKNSPDSITMGATPNIQYSLIEYSKFNELFRKSWESYGLTFEQTYHTLDRKTRKKINTNKDSDAKYETIDSLLSAIEVALKQDNTNHILANLAAYDFYAMKLLQKTNEGVYIGNTSIKWKKPLKQLTQALKVSGELTTKEMRNNALHYTTPDGWHCSFVQIGKYWYLYYQFDKLINTSEDVSIPKLPSIE